MEINALKDLAYYVNDKISVKSLNPSNFIGVDNILPNKKGVKKSLYVPTSGKATLFQKGDILIGNIRPYFKKIWLATFDGGCSQDVLCIRPNNPKYKEYIYSVLSQDYFFEYDMMGSKGSKMPRGDKKHIMDFPIVKINNPEKVGSFIVDIGRKIDNNICIINKSKEIIRLIYSKWFLQFDFPNSEKKPYKSSNEKLIWNEYYNCKIPDGWNVQNLYNNDLTKLIKPGISEFNGTKRYLATADVGNNKYTRGNLISYKNRESRANMQPTEKSVWFAKMKETDKYLYFGGESSKLLEKLILSTGFCGLQCNDENFEYVSSFISSKYFEKSKNQMAHGATQQAVNNNDLKNCKILIPPLDILKLYHDKTSSLFSIINEKNMENEKLEDVRNELLPILINGQIKIK